MLKSLDIPLTQVITGALGWRGRNLVRGVITILNRVSRWMLSSTSEGFAIPLDSSARSSAARASSSSDLAPGSSRAAPGSAPPPELPAPVRHGIAVVTEAPSQFAGRINACFDETMDL